MPRIRRQNLPPALLNHLLDRVAEREISASQLGRFADWLAAEPEVPDGPMVQTISRDDCLRRKRIGEDVSAIRAGSCGRRSELIATQLRDR